MRSDAMLSPLKPNDCAQGEKRNYWPEPPVLLCRWDGFWHLVAQQYRTGLQRGRSPCWRPQSQLSTRTLNTAPAAALSSSSVNAAAPPMPSRTWTASPGPLATGTPLYGLGLGALFSLSLRGRGEGRKFGATDCQARRHANFSTCNVPRSGPKIPTTPACPRFVELAKGDVLKIGKMT
jgi:hypothetical protein